MTEPAAKRKTSKRFWRRRRFQIPMVILVLLVCARNPLLRFAIEFVGHAASGCPVSVARVNLDLQKVVLQDIRCAEAGENSRSLLNTKRVELHFASWPQIRQGVYLAQINIDKPELRLRFDANGRLLTQLPSLPKSEKQDQEVSIPFAHLQVTNARLVIDQVGKPSFTGELNHLIVKCDKSYSAEAVIDDFLGGKIQLATQVDAQTLQGESTLSVTEVKLDSRTLTTLPFVPPIVGNEHIAGTGSVAISVTHPPNEFDPRKHDFLLKAQLEDIHSELTDALPTALQVAIRNQGGILSARLEMAPLEGQVAANIESNLMGWPLVVNAKASASQLDLHALADELQRFVPSLPEYHASTGMAANLQATIDESAIAFQGQLDTKVDQVQIDSLPLGDLSTTVSINGQLDRKDVSIQGTISGVSSWEGVEIRDIYERYLPTQTAIAGSSPPQITGNVHAQARFSIPLANLTDPRAFRVNGELVLENISAHEIVVEPTSITASLDEGNVLVQLPELLLANDERSLGKLSATVSGGVDAESDWYCSAKAHQFSIQSFVRFLGQDATGFHGEVNSSIDSTVQLAGILDPTQWQLAAQLDARDLMLQHESLSDIHAACYLDDGNISVPQVNVQWRDTTFAFLLQGTIDQLLQVRGQFATTPIYLHDIANALSRYSPERIPIQGSADIQGAFEVSALPMSFVTKGQSRLLDASYAGKRIGGAHLTWEATPDRLTIEHTSGDLLGGRSRTLAIIRSLDWTQTHLQGEFSDVPAQRLLAFAELELPATGFIDGAFELSQIQSLDSLRGKATLRSRGITVRDVKVELPSCELSVRQGEAVLGGRGQVSTGNFEFAGSTKLDRLIDFLREPDRKLHNVPVTAEFKLNKAPLQRLINAAGLDQELSQLDGYISLACLRDETSASRGAIGQVSFTTENITWDRSRISEFISGELSLESDRLILQRLQGRIADGRVSGNAEVTTVGKPRGLFRFSLTNVNLRRAAAPFLDTQLISSGLGSISVSGRIDNTIHARVTAEASNVTAAGIAIRRARMPIDASYSMASQIARWNCRSGVVEVGQGRVFLNSEGSFQRALTMNNTVRLEQVDTSKLVSGKSFGVGILNGVCTLQARKTNLPEKMTGSFDISMSQTEAMEMPILDQLPQMGQLPSLNLNAPTNNQGYVVGRFGGGTVHLEEMAINQSNVQVLASGQATLDGGLNLDVTASTNSDGPIDDLLSLADSPLMAAGAAPVALVARANDALKNRVIHVQVSGTAKNPNLRLNPGKQLSQQAVQFFLRSTLGSRIADTATSQRNRRR